MAEVLVEKLKNEQLNCSICLETYTDPKILQCFHVYCQKCLDKLVSKDRQGQLSLICPTCRQVTQVPANGTVDLHAAFQTNRLLESVDEHEKAKARRESVDSKAEGLSLNMAKSITSCSEHDGRELELFCETCEKLICCVCAIKDGKHHSHNYQYNDKAFKIYKEEVAPFLAPMDKKLKTVAEALAQFDKHDGEITDQQAITNKKIQDISEQLHEIIDNRRDVLIKQVDQITMRKLSSLATQRDQIMTLQAQLTSCLEFTRESLKTGIQQDKVLVMKTDILKQVRELATELQSDLLTPNTEADAEFLTLADAAIAECETYGKVYEPPDPSKCYATGEGTQEAVVGEKATATLNVVSYRGKPCDGAIIKSTSLEVAIFSGSKTIEHTVEHRGQGQFVISYQPTVRGRHQLHIKAAGQHISGSPFSIAVKLPIEKPGTSIRTLNELKNPGGVAVKGNGEVVVSEQDAHRVSVLSSDGEKLSSFGMHGTSEGEFDIPSGVAIDGAGNLMVIDRNNHRIQKFRDGHFLEVVGSKGSGTLQFESPIGIAYCASNKKVYVADTYNHRIQVLNSDLTFLSKFGKKGNVKQYFDKPSGVATDNTGKVYVADSGNHRIQIFTADGKFVGMFGKKGKGEGELDWPFGIAVDDNFVYVSELNNNRISVFTPEGVFVTLSGGQRSGPEKLNGPRGLTVYNHVVHVCDSVNNRIVIFC